MKQRQWIDNETLATFIIFYYTNIPSSINDVNFIPVGKRKWIDIETQESNDPCCFQVSKFSTRLLRHSKQVRSKEDGGVHYDQVIEECKKSYETIQDIGQTKCCSNSPKLRIGHVKIDISSGERWRTEEKVPVLREPELSSSISVPLSNPRTFRKHNQSCIARECAVTRRFHRVFLLRRKRKRIEVNSESWFDSRRSQSQNRQTCCILHCCESDG